MRTRGQLLQLRRAAPAGCRAVPRRAGGGRDRCERSSGHEAGAWHGHPVPGAVERAPFEFYYDIEKPLAPEPMRSRLPRQLRSGAASACGAWTTSTSRRARARSTRPRNGLQERMRAQAPREYIMMPDHPTTCCMASWMSGEQPDARCRDRREPRGEDRAVAPRRVQPRELPRCASRRRIRSATSRSRTVWAPASTASARRCQPVRAMTTRSDHRIEVLRSGGVPRLRPRTPGAGRVEGTGHPARDDLVRRGDRRATPGSRGRQRQRRRPGSSS